MCTDWLPEADPFAMKRKPHKCTAVVCKVWKWAYIYEILGPDGRPVYVGRTTNEKERAAAHQQESSNCKRLKNKIEIFRTESPAWTFAKSWRRVRGLEHGVPEEDAQKFEAYFIYTRETIFSLATPHGCNSREGDNAVAHELCFKDISTSLEALADGESLFLEKQRCDRLCGASHKLLEATAELDIVSDIRDACTDEHGACPECVEAVYALAETTHRAVSNTEETQSVLKQRKTQYNKICKQQVANRQEVVHEAFAKELNAFKNLLEDFIPNGDNPHQRLLHDMALRALKGATAFIGNGESHRPGPAVTAAMALDVFKVVGSCVACRDEAGGQPGHSFQSRLAWCKPNSELKGDLQDNLKRVEALLAETLTEEQRERAIKRKREVVAAISDRDGPRPERPCVSYEPPPTPADAAAVHREQLFRFP